MSWFLRKARLPRTKPPLPAEKASSTAIFTLVLSKIHPLHHSRCIYIDSFFRHCVGAGASESGSTAASCSLRERDYDLPIRIGTLFVVLVTSGIGVFAPILLSKFPSWSLNGTVFTVIKQFGTGIIIATAFVHVSFPNLLTFMFKPN